MIKQYVSNDGKVFNTKDDCLAYETGLKEEEEEKKKLKDEQNRRKEEIQKLYKDLSDKIVKYCEDYNQPVSISVNKPWLDRHWLGWGSIIDDLFRFF